MMDPDEGLHLNDDSLLHETGFSILHKRYEAITHVIDILNTRLPVVDKVLAIGKTLRPLLPFDQFCLGLFWLGKWYVMDEHGVVESRVKYTAGISDHFSASQWVMQHQKVKVRKDLKREKRFVYDAELIKKGFLSDLSVPLIADGYTVGAFNFNSRQKNAFGGAEVVRAKSVASAVATLVKLFQDQLFLDGIREISEAVQGSLNLNQVLDMVLDHIQSQGYDRVRVYLFDEKKQGLRGVAQVGGQEIRPFTDFQMSFDQDTYSQKTFASRRAQIFTMQDFEQRPIDWLDQFFDGLGYDEKADLPLFVGENGKDRIIGKVTLDNGLSKRPLLEERLDALMVYASQVAIAIRHAQLYQRLEQEVEERTLLLRESEERFRRLSEAAFEGVVLIEDGLIIDVNNQYCQMLNYTRAELLQKPVLDMVAPQFHPRVQHYIETNYEEPYESVMVRKDGTRFPIEVRARKVPYEGRMVRVAAIRDISDRSLIEQEQIRIARVNAIGELAQGVAHNFNNILVGVLGNAQLIQLRSKDAEVLADANLIVESALRAKKLVQGLQLSIQGDKEYTLEVDINRAILAAVNLTQPRWKDESEVKGITIKVDLDLANVPPIWGAHERLCDIIVNLILNAVEALPSGGAIYIQTLKKDDLIKIVFSDTGVGMSEEILLRVFDPFFTTKLNVGSGLGLSIVQGTIKSWGGSVTVKSKEGAGTTFEMVLPQYKKEVS